MKKLLEVKNLKTHFRMGNRRVKALDGIDYYIKEGEVVGLVGESGCGKSVSQLSVLQLLQTPPGEIVDGQVLFGGEDLLTFSAKGREMQSVRGGKIGMIFQEPMTSLNPVLTVGRQLTEPLELHLKMSKREARRRAIEILREVSIPDAIRRIGDYPHQFSGGMRQRIMIGMALACKPRLLIADEPTTALDVTTQAQIMDLMIERVSSNSSSLVVVTHDLGIVARYVNRIYVMYAGRIVESGTAKAIYRNPCHPYTKGLLQSVPRLDQDHRGKLLTIMGSPPDLGELPGTCAFLPRCSFQIGTCQEEPWPELREIDPHHYIACYANT